MQRRFKFAKKKELQLNVPSAEKVEQKRKYGNKKVVYDGITFDSKKEKDRYVYLKDCERLGLITDLEIHPKFILVDSIKENYEKQLKTKKKICQRVVQLAITYTADFRYKKGEVVVVEDVKPSPKMLCKEFLLKVKMLRAFKGIAVRLVYKANEEI